MKILLVIIPLLECCYCHYYSFTASPAAFLGNVLRAGCNNFNGDKIQVPEDARGYVMKDGKRQRLHHVMPVVSAPA